MDQLYWISIFSLILGFFSFSIILIDILSGNKQKMTIMNIVWPITGLYASILGLIAYFTIGRKSSVKKDQAEKPFWQSVIVGALHCGSGCTLGDIVAETFVFLVPVIILGSALAGKWIIDYAAAFLLGIIFQYYSIKPMKGLSPKKGIVEAIKADTLSLTAWQFGMYGWMAIAIFLIFNRELEYTEPLFWFMMQIAMLLGFCTSYPVNWWLIRKGVKESM